MVPIKRLTLSTQRTPITHPSEAPTKWRKHIDPESFIRSFHVGQRQQLYTHRAGRDRLDPSSLTHFRPMHV